jgi:hypothetical protein
VGSGYVVGLDPLVSSWDLLGLQLLGSDGGRVCLGSGDVGGLDHMVPGGDLLCLQLFGGDGGGESLGRRDVGELDSVDIVPDLGHSVNKLNSSPFPETAAGGTIFSGNRACTCSMYSPLSVMPLTTCFHKGSLDHFVRFWSHKLHHFDDF